MSTSRSAALQQLDRLDRSSVNFLPQLDHILDGQAYKECVPTLEGDELVWLVDYLDKVFNSIDSSHATYQKCLSELRELCRSKIILPTSYTLSHHDLQVSPEWFSSGAYGDVYQGAFSGSRVRVKRLRVPHPEYASAAGKVFCNGAVSWKFLKHPNIVYPLGFTINPPQLVSEWMPNGDLPEYVKENRLADIVALLSDVARGIEYLHSCDIIHREIKGSNILVDPSGHARVSDFGFAVATMGEDFAMIAYRPLYGLRWTAPEVLTNTVCSKAADIFSFGMLMVEVFTGKIPFNDLVSFGPAFAIIEGQRPPRPTHAAVTGDLWKLMQSCWDPDSNLRPNATEVLGVLSPKK